MDVYQDNRHGREVVGWVRYLLASHAADHHMYENSPSYNNPTMISQLDSRYNVVAKER